MEIRTEFANEKDLLDYIRKVGFAFSSQFKLVEKEKVRDNLNGFYTHFLKSTEQNEKLYWQIYLSYIDTLNYYAQDYGCQETLDNIFSEFSKDQVKQKLFTSTPIGVRAKLVISVTYVIQYYLTRETATDDETRKKEFIDPILTAKSYLSKIYGRYLADKRVLNEGQFVRCCETLGTCYGALSRWYEALYYINLAVVTEKEMNVNLAFTKAGVLDRIQTNTCSDYSSLLLLEIIDSAKFIYTKKFYPKETIQSFQDMASERRKVFKKNKISIPELRRHKLKASKASEGYNRYEKFCLVNQLYLNEHSQYCCCRKATRDNITIRSGHTHTHIDFVEPFDKMMDAIVFDFALARQNYYDALVSTDSGRIALRSLKRENYKRSSKMSLLKDSFRLCYSIFDTISISILEALEIDYKNIRMETDDKRNVHFTNIWDDLITSEHFDENYYVQTLYSIAYDIKSKTSGHKEFRDIRNAMEHKVFYVLKKGERFGKSKFKKDSYFEIKEEELYEKTKLLLVYTKSLIMTYAYFMRRVSVKKDPRQSTMLHAEKR